MDIEEQEHLGLPLLEDAEDEGVILKPKKSPTQRAMRKTFKGTAHLANLLPTGTVLAFRILSPVFTHEGKCKSVVSQSMTLVLLACCAISCIVISFTDSFRDERGKVRYGFATFRGLCILDMTSVSLSPDEAAKYRLRFLDFFHAFNSLLVFAVTALLDQNVVNCLLPSPSAEVEELLAMLPVGIGFICSLLFVTFPSKRHGIGFPLSRD
nr:protein DMP7 [Ipomoea batatas]